MTYCGLKRMANDSTLLPPHLSPVYMGSMCPTSCLLISRFCVCSPDNTFFLNSSFALSIHLRFGLPFLLPVHTHPRLLSPHLFVIPSHDMAVSSCTFLNISPTFVVPLILSILILSIFCNTTHIFKHPHFCHVQLLLLRFLRYRGLSTV